MSSQVNTTSGTSFSEIKAAYVNSGQTNGNSSLNDDSETSAISLSYFQNTTFTDGNDAPGSGAFSINSVFRTSTTDKNGNTTISGKTFSGGEDSGEDDY